MRNTEGVRSVHFPESPAKAPSPATEAKPDVPNILEVFAEALRDVELVRSRLRGLLTTDSRHGDLQAALSATRRVEEKLQTLIDHEER